MKRTVVLLLGVMLAMLVVGGTVLAYAQSDDGANALAGGKKKVDSARGEGQLIHEEASGTLTTSFKFHAKNLDRASDEADGTVSFTNSQGSLSQSATGNVECLRVSKINKDKVGYFVFVITESSGTDAPPGGTRIGVNILDTGKKHGKGDGARGGPVEATASCVDPTGEVDSLSKGNIKIRDRRPA